MTAFYKIIVNGYIDGIGTNCSNNIPPISEAEYNSLLTVIRSKPTAPIGFEYQLRAETLEWELAELPPEDEYATAEDYEAALGRFGV